MNNSISIILNAQKATANKAARKTGSAQSRFCICGAIFGLAVGAVLMALGLTLCTVAYITDSNVVSLTVETIGTWAMAASLPVFLIGAHCLSAIYGCAYQTAKAQKEFYGTGKQFFNDAPKQNHSLRTY